jgi:hypothetical protein
MSLWEFSWKFWDFQSIFHAFKQFLEFFSNCFRIKNRFEKNKPYLTGMSPKARPRSAPAQPSARAGPIWAWRCGHGVLGRETGRRPPPRLGVHARGTSVPTPYLRLRCIPFPTAFLALAAAPHPLPAPPPEVEPPPAMLDSPAWRSTKWKWTPPGSSLCRAAPSPLFSTTGGLRSTAAHGYPSRPPWILPLAISPCLSVQGEPPLVFPSVSSLFSPTRRAPGHPNHRRHRPPETSERLCSLSGLDRGRRKEFLHITPWVPENLLNPIVCLRSFAENPLDLLGLQNQLHPRPFYRSNLELY